MNPPKHRRPKHPRKNPYAALHQKLVDFASNAELDPELVARNEFLRLENLILRGLFFEKKERLRLSEDEKQMLASAAVKVKGRTKVSASLLTPGQVVRYSHKAAGKKYVSLFPRKPNPVRISKAYKEDILRSIVEEHPNW